MKLAPNTIRGKVSALRFWHILSGLSAFAKEGGRYKEVLKSLMRGTSVNRKIPFGLDLLQWAYEQSVVAGGLDSNVQDELLCASTLGFYYLLRVGEIEGLRMKDIRLNIDDDGDTTLTIHIISSKTDQYNDGAFKTLKSVPEPICPVKMWSKFMSSVTYDTLSAQKIFPPGIRSRLTVFLRLAGVSNGIASSRIGNHSLRSGGATAMFQAGYDIEVIKRWGRWRSGSFHSYLWNDQRILATIGRGMSESKGNLSQYKIQGEHPQPAPHQVRFAEQITPIPSRMEQLSSHEWIEKRCDNDSDATEAPSIRSAIPSSDSGIAGGRGKGRCKGGKNWDSRTLISKAMSAVLRHKLKPIMQKDGFLPVNSILQDPDIQEQQATKVDLYAICQGDGGNHKLRFEKGYMANGDDAIRAAQGHSAKMGVSADHMPTRPDLLFCIHGTTLDAAHSIVQQGLNRGSRTHIHMFEGNAMGHTRHFDCNIRSQCEVIVIIDAAACVTDDICEFLESTNKVILSEGFGGLIPRGYIVRVVNRQRREVYSGTTQKWIDGYQPLTDKEDSETEAVNMEPNSLGTIRQEPPRQYKRIRTLSDIASSSEAGSCAPTASVITRKARVPKKKRLQTRCRTVSDEDFQPYTPSVVTRNIDNKGDEEFQTYTPSVLPEISRTMRMKNKSCLMHNHHFSLTMKTFLIQCLNPICPIRRNRSLYLRRNRILGKVDEGSSGNWAPRIISMIRVVRRRRRRRG